MIVRIFPKYLKFSRFLSIAWRLACGETKENYQRRLVTNSLSIVSADGSTKRERKREGKRHREKRDVSWRKSIGVSCTGESVWFYGRPSSPSTSLAAVLSLATSVWRGQCVKITRSAVDIDLSLSPRTSRSMREARSKCRSQSSGSFVCRKS